VAQGGPVPATEIPARIEAVRRRIEVAARRAGRDPAGVTLIAACKTVDADRLRVGLEHGLKHLGENRVQEAEPKMRALGAGPVWHFVGHLQSNKAARAAALFDWVHSVDSLELGKRLERAAREAGRKLHILIQVNLSGEPTKSGVGPGEAEALAAALADQQAAPLCGLMTIPAPVAQAELQRPAFRRLRELRDAINRALRAERPLEALSMGMTEDFEVAIEEGATHIRLGRALFGDRPSIGAPNLGYGKDGGK
jgi:pyridoxal phosphate enzyme (YggS family)